MFRALLTRLLLPLIALTSFSQPSIAGGDIAEVTISSLRLLSDTNYVLVISPPPSLGWEHRIDHCKNFEVRGTLPVFSRRKENHKAALAYLKDAFDNRRLVLFGFMGTGFKPVNKDNVCIVASERLELKSENGETFVLSYYGSMA